MSKWMDQHQFISGVFWLFVFLGMIIVGLHGLEYIGNAMGMNDKTHTCVESSRGVIVCGEEVPR